MEQNSSPTITLRPGLTQGEVAARLSISRRTLNSWVHKGHGPRPVRVGAALLYNPADVAAFKAGAR